MAIIRSVISKINIQPMNNKLSKVTKPVLALATLDTTIRAYGIHKLPPHHAFSQ